MRPGRVGAKAVSTRPAISRAGAKPRCSQPRMRGLRGRFPSSAATATSSSGLSATAIITNLRFRNLRLRRLPPEAPESNSRSRPVRSASRASRNHPTHARGLVAGPASRLPDGFDTGHSFVAVRLGRFQEVPHHRRHPLNPPTLGRRTSAIRAWDGGREEEWFRLSRSLRSRAGSTGVREFVAVRLDRFRRLGLARVTPWHAPLKNSSPPTGPRP